MKKITLLVLASVLMFGVVAGALPAQAIASSTETVDSSDTPVQLTDAQKKELADLNKEVIDKKKELISKYVEYGVMTEEKGKIVISKLEERYENLEKNGFVYPQNNKLKKRFCR